MGKRGLITVVQRDLMIRNGLISARDPAHSPEPVVKLFGGGAMTWLLTELDPQDHDIAYGLCDIGQGTPELGSVRLSELEAQAFPPFNLGVERDLYFKPTMSIGRYAALARQAGRIVYE